MNANTAIVNKAMRENYLKSLVRSSKHQKDDDKGRVLIEKTSKNFPDCVKCDRFLNNIERARTLPRKLTVPNIRNSRLKGFEEIGVFSDLIHPKKFYKDDSENSSSQKTIHITDFMARRQKQKLTQLAGLNSEYELKRRGYQQKFLSREQAVQQFLVPSEKLPKFFSPQISPRHLADCDFESKLSAQDSHSPIAAKLDNLIERCNKAISLRLKYPVF